MKAYVLSETYGTVQIGRTVFQPCTGARFRAPLQGVKKIALRVENVRNVSIKSALSALKGIDNKK